jgi:hypothetical protein
MTFMTLAAIAPSVVIRVRNHRLMLFVSVDRHLLRCRQPERARPLRLHAVLQRSGGDPGDREHRPDRVGHVLLDGVQPHHDLGLAHLLLHNGLLLQLRDRRSVRRFADQGHVGSEVLVHDGPVRDDLDNAGAGVAVLLRGRGPHPVGPCQVEAAAGPGALQTQPGRAEDAVGEKSTPVDPVRLRVRPPGGLWQADHVGQDHEEAAEFGFQPADHQGQVEHQLGRQQHHGGGRQNDGAALAGEQQQQRESAHTGSRHDQSVKYGDPRLEFRGVLTLSLKQSFKWNLLEFLAHVTFSRRGVYIQTEVRCFYHDEDIIFAPTFKYFANVIFHLNSICTVSRELFYVIRLSTRMSSCRRSVMLRSVKITAN